MPTMSLEIAILQERDNFYYDTENQIIKTVREKTAGRRIFQSNRGSAGTTYGMSIPSCLNLASKDRLRQEEEEAFNYNIWEL